MKNVAIKKLEKKYSLVYLLVADNREYMKFYYSWNFYYSNFLQENCIQVLLFTVIVCNNSYISQQSERIVIEKQKTEE